MSLPILYSFRRCPYAMRARTALVYAGVPYILREVDLKNKPQQLLEISPKGTVPVLVLANGAVLEESLDIIDWALTQNDPQNWKGTAFKAEIDDLIADNDAHFTKILRTFKYPDRYPDQDQKVVRQQVLAHLKSLENRLEGHDFLVTEQPTRADVALFPFIRQCAGVDKPFWEGAPCPRLKKWLASFVDHPRFDTVMARHNPWTQGEEPVEIHPIV